MGGRETNNLLPHEFSQICQILTRIFCETIFLPTIDIASILSCYGDYQTFSSKKSKALWAFISRPRLHRSLSFFDKNHETWSPLKKLLIYQLYNDCINRRQPYPMLFQQRTHKAFLRSILEVQYVMIIMKGRSKIPIFETTLAVNNAINLLLGPPKNGVI